MKQPSGIEYWFFKVNAGSTALLVDWIAQHTLNRSFIRLSIHTPTDRRVWVEPCLPQHATIRSFLTASHTAGCHAGLAWNLTITNPGGWIIPDIFPARRLNLTDMTLESAPHASFSGWIRYHGITTVVDTAPGVVSHYRGRRLAPEWWWIAAQQFDDPTLIVECSVFRSSLWGSAGTLPLAYLYLHHNANRSLWMSPPSLVHVAGDPTNLTIQWKRLGQPLMTLKATGRDYGDLGDGIINTLVGDLEVWSNTTLLGRASGTAALERRHATLKDEP